MTRELSDIPDDEVPMMLSVEFPTWNGVSLSQAGESLSAIARSWMESKDPHDVCIEYGMQLQASVVRGDMEGALPIIVRGRLANGEDQVVLYDLLDRANLTRSRLEGPVDMTKPDPEL